MQYSHYEFFDEVYQELIWLETTAYKLKEGDVIVFHAENLFKDACICWKNTIQHLKEDTQGITEHIEGW